MWLTAGLVVGIAAISLYIWLKNRNIETKWYDWLVIALGIALLLFTLQNFIGAIQEYESTAAWWFLVATGIPALILFLVAFRLIQSRKA
jgi:multisubunit Na+/H+ antiporter MnhB subunit